jgi:hypothetical protein
MPRINGSFKTLKGETMATKLEIIHAQDFIRTTPAGELDWAKTEEIFTAIAMAAEDLPDFVILVDLRNIQTATLTTIEVWDLAELLIRYGRVFVRKTALLIPADAPGDRARFFEDCAHNRGFQIKVFRDFEGALDWLAPPTEVAAR